MTVIAKGSLSARKTSEVKGGRSCSLTFCGEEIGARLANQHPDAVVFVDSLSISSLTHALDGDSSTYLTSGRAVPELSSSKVVHQGVPHATILERLGLEVRVKGRGFHLVLGR